MFSQMLFVRLKAAENALRDGRLDEAFRLAMAPDIREHRRGGVVLAALAERFLERARNHYRTERFTEAFMDLEKAAAGGVKTEEIAELRRQVQTVAAEVQRKEHDRRGRLEAARRRIEGGSLAAGQRILEQASAKDHDAHLLRQTAESLADEVERLIGQADKLSGEGHDAAAAEQIRKAARLDRNNELVRQAEARLCRKVTEQAMQCFAQGRPGRAAEEIACLQNLTGATLPALRELQDWLQRLREAALAASAHQYGQARRLLLAVQRQATGIRWVQEAAEQMRQLDEVHTAVSAGPLGDWIDFTPGEPAGGHRNDIKGKDRGAQAAGKRPMKKAPGLEDTVMLPDRAGLSSGLPDRLLLLVDGGGSYLLLRNGQASVGRAAADHPADVPIFGDLSERHANITRVDEDYFLFSSRDVEIGGRPTRHQLLQDGARVVLGRKAKFTFRLPSRMSPSACLDLSDTTKMPHDVRRVVLFHRLAMVGEGGNAHMRCRHAGPPLVIFERNGGLWIRQKSDGHVDTAAQPLTLGETVEIGGARLVVQPWQAAPPGSRMT